MNRRELDCYDKATLHLGRLEQGLELLGDQAASGDESLPDGFWFIHAGLERAAKKMRKALDKMADKERPPLAVVDNGEGA